jgi:hypothetical protein
VAMEETVSHLQDFVPHTINWVELILYTRLNEGNKHHDFKCWGRRVVLHGQNSMCYCSGIERHRSLQTLSNMLADSCFDLDYLRAPCWYKRVFTLSPLTSWCHGDDDRVPILSNFFLESWWWIQFFHFLKIRSAKSRLSWDTHVKTRPSMLNMSWKISAVKSNTYLTEHLPGTFLQWRWSPIDLSATWQHLWVKSHWNSNHILRNFHSNSSMMAIC